MEKWIRRFVRRMAVKMEFDAEREAVVAYGLIALVQITVTLALVLALGFLVGAPVEAAKLPSLPPPMVCPVNDTPNSWASAFA